MPAQTRTESQRLKEEGERAVEVIKESGGPVEFVFDYLKYLDDLRKAGENQPAVAMAGKQFKSSVVQIAAVGAVEYAANISPLWKKEGLHLPQEHAETLRAAARAAYVGAAGHFTKESLSSLPESGTQAKLRRQKAEYDWDLLIKADPEKLIRLAIGIDQDSGREIKLSIDVYISSVLQFFIVFSVSYFIYNYIEKVEDIEYIDSIKSLIYFGIITVKSSTAISFIKTLASGIILSLIFGLFYSIIFVKICSMYFRFNLSKYADWSSIAFVLMLILAIITSSLSHIYYII